MPIGQRRQAQNIPCNLCIGRDFESAHPVKDEIDWLSQFIPCWTGYSYLIEGDETAPTRIWECRNEACDHNRLTTYYTCVWEDEDAVLQDGEEDAG